ncbi:acetylcholinesterase [Colletotrichum simmondsii]|uniref:Carboxylic ester hydrolase n=1 Tax=Colletotrichum simmondsii TaxID=703756 RepID=A0A135T397_9PEZI|nr:acetylcholinesterase [Colletotrichum simmondsii]
MKLSQVIQILSVCIVPTIADEPFPTAQIGRAKYIGLQNNTSGINSFYGIRYAKSPVGELRWRPPVATEDDFNQSTAVNTTRRGPSCIQSTPSWGFQVEPPAQEDEDCLLLDVLTPISPVSESLPVMVQIHGGGYTGGNSTSSPGDSMVYHSNGSMIYVAIQYRLGPLGFLAGDELTRDGSWNVGLLDQRAALNWIQKNIHQFGGDPSKITITGGSAGGGSVSLQMTLYGGSQRPPFRAAIPEYPWWTPMYNKEFLNKQYSRFSSAANCTSLSCLRKLPASGIKAATQKSFQSAYNAHEFAYGNFYWGPSVDGNIVRGHPLEEFRSGRFTKVPVLVNHNGYEGILFSNTTMTTQDELLADLQTLWPSLPESKIADLLEFYPTSTYNGTVLDRLTVLAALSASTGQELELSDVFARRQAIFGDSLINCPTTYIATAATKAGTKAYKMIFDAGNQLHGATVPFLFSTTINPSGEIPFSTTVAPGNATLASYMRDYFVSFSLYLHPNGFAAGQQAPYFPRYDSQDLDTLLISQKSIQLGADPEKAARCEQLDITQGNV